MKLHVNCFLLCQNAQLDKKITNGVYYTTLWRSIIFHGRSSILLILLFFQTQDMFLTELNEHGLKKPLVGLMLQIRSLHLHYHWMTGNVNLTDGR